MSLDQSYNHDHWDKRLKQYINADWSQKPTPFAEFVEEKLARNSRVLELGAGGGQDSLFFATQGHKVTLTDGADIVFGEIKQRANIVGTTLECRVVDMAKPLPFEAESFDVVYAQLAIHYFDDETTQALIAEILRVLKPDGIFAGMVNTKDDPEYDKSLDTAGNGLIPVKGLVKRFFTLESFKPYLDVFKLDIYDAEGSTPKDDEVGTHHLIRFIARKVS